MDHKSEIRCQYEALNELSHGDSVVADNICQYENMIIPILFREIINEFCKNLHKDATHNDLIWCTSVKLGFNIRALG